MRLVRVPAALALVALGIAAPIMVGLPACHLRTGPENDAQVRGFDARGGGDGGVHDGGIVLDAGRSDASFDAGMLDGGAAVDAMPDAAAF
jgi:hypothetical protein